MAIPQKLYPNRGFASMDPDKQREIASLGGKATHKAGTAHEWNSEEAAKAGQKGGTITAKRKANKKNGVKNDRNRS